MRYRDYLIRRLLTTIPAFIGLSILIFVVARVIPGDAARLALGPEASKGQVEQLRREMGLDLPLHDQYIRYVAGIFQGKLGRSLYTHRDVAEDLAAYLPATLELTSVAMLLAVLLGVPLGVITAMRKDKWEDQVGRVYAFSGVSMPRFWIGILLQLLLAYRLGWLPTTGRFDANLTPPVQITGFYLLDSLLSADWAAFGITLKYLLLPSFVLALSPTAQIMRVVRASMIEQVRKGYILNAAANGMPQNLMVYKYSLKNALIAAVTIIGLMYGFFLAGAFVVESVFAWPGMGRYGVRALIFKDFNAMVGVTLVVGLAYTVINFATDILYGYLDPRIRLGYNKGR